MPAAPVPNRARLSNSGVALSAGGLLPLPFPFPLPPPFPLPFPPGAAAIGVAFIKPRHSSAPTVTIRTRIAFMARTLVRRDMQGGIGEVAVWLSGVFIAALGECVTPANMAFGTLAGTVRGTPMSRLALRLECQEVVCLTF